MKEKAWEASGADRSQLGLVHVYTGDGKGKTTASVGLAVRALGRGLRVAFVQFLKDGHSGELEMLRRLGATVVSGMPDRGFTWELPEAAAEALKALSVQRLEEAARLMDSVDLLVLDEVIGAASFGYADEAQFLALLDARPAHVEVVLTGRSPSDEVLARADYVSEVILRKHPFVDRGLDARAGIEF